MNPAPQTESILVAHPWIGRGGSEATCLWVLDTLQRSSRVEHLTFTTGSDLDWEALNAAYGTSVDPALLTVIKAPSLPGITTGTQLVDLQHSLFGRHCKRLARSFDRCLSAYNPIDFGKPGVQLLGDFSWHEGLRRQLYPNAGLHYKHQENFLRRTYLRTSEIVRGRTRPLTERGDLILANSVWTQDILHESCQLESTVLYPPVQLPRSSVDGAHNSEHAFVAVGRISPEKELEQSIAILDRLRSSGHAVTLEIAGAPGGDLDYVQKIDHLCSEREWITRHGFLNAEQLDAVFARCSFGIHSCGMEAFGIAVAEMAARGCLPFVPKSGGGTEVVRCSELHYRNIDDAVSRIEPLLLSPEKAARLRVEAADGVQRFSPEKFSETLLSILFP